MYFAVSGVEVAPHIPFTAAFAISFLTSMAGVSGAFLLLPFQISVLGYTNPSVSATNHVFNTLATPGGIYRYYREGRMLFPLAVLTTVGSLPGVVIGAYIRLHWLAEIQSFKLFAALVLLYLAFRMGRDLLTHKANAPAPGAAQPRMLELSLRRASFTFQDQLFCFNPWHIFLLTAIIGVIGGIYGIGGGSILSPFLVSVFGLPVHVIAGPTLVCTLATSLGGICTYMVLAPLYPHLSISPDWLLGALLGAGGLLGMYAGARVQKYVRPGPILFLLTLLVTGTAFTWLLPQLGLWLERI